MFFPACFMAAQISLLVGVVGTLVSLVIGVLWGAMAGYVGGRMDSVMMRIVDMLYSLPSVIFVIVLVTTLGEVLKQSHLVQQSPAMEAGCACSCCSSDWAPFRGSPWRELCADRCCPCAPGNLWRPAGRLGANRIGFWRATSSPTFWAWSLPTWR